MRVWILCKQDHFERYENRRFVEEAKKRRISLKLVSPNDFDIIVTKRGRKSIHYQGEEVKLPKCLIPRMGAGTNYFARALIRHLEKLGVLILNSSESIQLSMDKLASLQALSTKKIPIPKTMLARFPVDPERTRKRFTYPFCN